MNLKQKLAHYANVADDLYARLCNHGCHASMTAFVGVMRGLLPKALHKINSQAQQLRALGDKCRNQAARIIQLEQWAAGYADDGLTALEALELSRNSHRMTIEACGVIGADLEKARKERDDAEARAVDLDRRNKGLMVGHQRLFTESQELRAVNKSLGDRIVNARELIDTRADELVEANRTIQRMQDVARTMSQKLDSANKERNEWRAESERVQRVCDEYGLRIEKLTKDLDSIRGDSTWVLVQEARAERDRFAAASKQNADAALKLRGELNQAQAAHAEASKSLQAAIDVKHEAEKTIRVLRHDVSNLQSQLASAVANDRRQNERYDALQNSHTKAMQEVGALKQELAEADHQANLRSEVNNDLSKQVNSLLQAKLLVESRLESVKRGYDSLSKVNADMQKRHDQMLATLAAPVCMANPTFTVDIKDCDIGPISEMVANAKRSPNIVKLSSLAVDNKSDDLTWSHEDDKIKLSFTLSHKK